MTEIAKTKEAWRDVVGYEGHYQVSNIGQVRAIKEKDSLDRPRNSIIMKQNTRGTNACYKCVCLSADEILLPYCKNQGSLEEREMPNIHDCKCEDKTTNYHLTVCCKGMKNEDGTLNKSDFYKEIEQTINRHSKENGSNTPDWVLAEYLECCLTTFDACVNLRERYYGRER